MPGLLVKFAAAAGVVLTHAAAMNLTDLPPPKIEFVGQTPKFKIFPGGEKTKGAAWIMISFGNVQEFGLGGKPVQSHSIRDLAAEKPKFETASDITLNGVKAQKVEMTLTLPFNTSDCPSGASVAAASRIASVKVTTIVFSEDAAVPYGNYTVSIKKGQLKFNFVAENWPFCGKDHSLTLAMALTVPSDETGKPPKVPKVMAARPPPPQQRQNETAAERLARLRPKGQEFTADAGEGNSVALDMPEIALLDGKEASMSVTQDTTGGRTVIKFNFPHFESSLLYDPSVGFALAEEDAATVSGAARSSVFGALLACIAGFSLPGLLQ